VALVCEAEAVEPSTAQSGFLADRIIHVHPTRLCNLACTHCYSESGPQQRGAIDLQLLLPALRLLKGEGYRVISLSGGEPLLYKSIEAVVDKAREAGLRVTMITNGLLATEGMLPLLCRLDAMAISFDGLAATHNNVRGRAHAFEDASSTLAWLVEKGITVAAAVSLTRDAIPELPDLVDHIVSLGAKAIQIRPVARAGRAKLMLGSSFYSEDDQARLYLVVLALQEELGNKVRLHCDLVPAKDIWDRRTNYAGLLATCARRDSERSLSDLVNPLVITATGMLKPIAYDFAESFNIGTLETMSAQTLVEYKRTGVMPLQSLIGLALGHLKEARGFVDWFDYCTRLSERNVS
jgi:pyruvate-formate lyase-activating enzyme